jgi:dTMP kinase
MGVLCELFLFMASRAELTAEVIRPALESDVAVVTDRYMLSTVAYQGHAGGIDPDELWQVGRLATGGLVPDLSIVLDLPVEKALSRRARSADRVELRSRDFHQAVREGFLREAGRYPDRIAVVDASPPVEAVHQRIISEVARVLETSAGA